jgi:hypothetical protein
MGRERTKHALREELGEGGGLLADSMRNWRTEMGVVEGVTAVEGGTVMVRLVLAGILCVHKCGAGDGGDKFVDRSRTIDAEFMRS